MFVVRTHRTALGTSDAGDALARFRMMLHSGSEPVVTTLNGKIVPPASLERWIAVGSRARNSHSTRII